MEFLLLLFISNIFCQPEKIHIVNIGDENFKSEVTKNLIFVFNHMKHGASSPCYGLNSYYTDIFDQKWDGFCELTKKGYLQLFKLGRIYQERYYRLLDISKPDTNKVKSFASQANKTLMSSNAFFFGMYYNNNTPIETQLTVPVRNFKNYVGNELIPIFYYGDRMNCKGWNATVKSNINNNVKEFNNYFNNFINKYQNVFDQFIYDERIINNKSPLDKVKIFCSSYISNYYDERYHNIEIFKTLNYTEEQFYNLYYDCLELNYYRYMNIEFGGEGEKVPMLILSDLIKDIIFYMDEIIQNSQNPKFVSYIGHDSTMAGFQIILNKAFNVRPKLMSFGSNQLFLLYKVSDTENEKEKNYNVKYFYNDQLSMSINYSEFKTNLLNIIKNEDELELFCDGLKPYDYVLLSLCSGIIILFLSIVSICCYNRNIIFNRKIYMSLKEETKEKSVEIKN